jgi:CBS domain-containing protein
MTPGPDVRASRAVKRVPSVRELMTRRFVSVTASTPIGEVARTLVRRGAPVAAVIGEDGRFAGFVSARGVLAALANFLHDEQPVAPLLEYLEADPPALSEDASLMEAIRLFRESAALEIALPVLRGGEIVGLVMRLDVIRAAMGYLGGAKDKAPGTLYISATRGKDEEKPY